MIEFNRKYTWGNGCAVYMLKHSRKGKLSLILVSEHGALINRRVTTAGPMRRHLSGQLEKYNLRYVD